MHRDGDERADACGRDHERDGRDCGDDALGARRRRGGRGRSGPARARTGVRGGRPAGRSTPAAGGRRRGGGQRRLRRLGRPWRRGRGRGPRRRSFGRPGRAGRSRRGGRGGPAGGSSSRRVLRPPLLGGRGRGRSGSLGRSADSARLGGIGGVPGLIRLAHRCVASSDGRGCRRGNRHVPTTLLGRPEHQLCATWWDSASSPNADRSSTSLGTRPRETQLRRSAHTSIGGRIDERAQQRDRHD